MLTIFKCRICGKKKEYTHEIKFKEHYCSNCDSCTSNKSMDNIGFFCPLCKRKLSKKYEGFVCNHHNCAMHFKLERGWVYLTKEKKSSILFDKLKYDFDPYNLKNKKEWLQLKSEKIYEAGCCENCNDDNCLHVHHIMPQSHYPELSLDKENLIVLCEKCHKEIHSKDKHNFSKGVIE